MIAIKEIIQFIHTEKESFGLGKKFIKITAELNALFFSFYFSSLLFFCHFVLGEMRLSARVQTSAHV